MIENINKYIEHTVLSAFATEKDVERVCAEAKKYNFASVCVNPVYVPLAVSELQNTPVKICTVVGFPLGAVSTDDKVCETKNAIQNGQVFNFFGHDWRIVFVNETESVATFWMADPYTPDSYKGQDE